MSEFLKVPHLSIEEYLAQEGRANVRNEYVNGQIFAMTGATAAHNLISGNLFALLHGHLMGSRCRPFIHDMKVAVEIANSFYYPDVMVTCEPFDPKSIYQRSPVLIAEVLSPSTKHIDRREKLIAYRKLESLREYLIIHQNRYRIELYRRDADGQWEYSVAGKTDLLDLNSFPTALQVPVSTIYNGVVLDPVVEEEEEEYAFS
jgi:Uma2 family endonuclease